MRESIYRSAQYSVQPSKLKFTFTYDKCLTTGFNLVLPTNFCLRSSGEGAYTGITKRNPQRLSRIWITGFRIRALVRAPRAMRTTFVIIRNHFGVPELYFAELEPPNKLRTLERFSRLRILGSHSFVHIIFCLVDFCFGLFRASQRFFSLCSVSQCFCPTYVGFRRN